MAAREERLKHGSFDFKKDTFIGHNEEPKLSWSTWKAVKFDGELLWSKSSSVYYIPINNPPGETICVWDGKVCKRYGPIAYKDGTTGMTGRIDNTFPESSYQLHLPMLRMERWSAILRNAFRTKPNLKWRISETLLADERLVCMECIEPNSISKTYWSVDRDFMVMRHTIELKKRDGVPRLASEWWAERTEQIEGLWVQTVAIEEKQGEWSNREVTELTHFTLVAPKAEEFKYEYPVGTKVVDQLGATEYVIGANGAHEPIPAEGNKPDGKAGAGK